MIEKDDLFVLKPNHVDNRMGVAFDAAFVYGAQNAIIGASQHAKADHGKPNTVLLEKGCVKALRVVQATLDYGALKYEANSWKTVPKGQDRYDAAARRHRIKRDMGEQFDKESRLAHLAHEIISNLFLLELMIEADPGCDWLNFNPHPPQDHKGDHDAEPTV